MSALTELQAKVDELTAKATDLQTSLDAEQEQIAALLASNAQVVTDLTTQVATLQEQIASGATADELAAVAAQIQATTDSLSTTQEDLEGTV